MKCKVVCIALLLSIGIAGCSKKLNVSKVVADAEKQTKVMLAEIIEAKAAKSGLVNGATPGSTGGELVSPRTLEEDKLKLVTSRDWTSGFFPGVLWFLNEQTGKAEWQTEAKKFTANIEGEKMNGTTHDMGFKIYCSFGTGYRLTNDQHYKDVIIQAAKTLVTRFNPTIGSLRSWDHSIDKYNFPVIIDNMMNLELLFVATQLTGDSSFYKIAVAHANTTLKNHYRPDFSSFHVVDYDHVTGNIKKKVTHQGYSNSSSWARGQSWGLYGFTVCYRFTKDPAYLRQAQGIANFILNHKNLPQDLVPYWDFDAPDIPNAIRDASSAALNASALLELSLHTSNSNDYKQKAGKILESLTKSYRSPIGENKGFLLLHSTKGPSMTSEADVPIIYADYYYLEALLRSKKMKEGKQLW